MPDAQLVTHAVLHCNAGSSDKVWAGLVVQTPGQPAQTLTYYGKRGASLNVSAKEFRSTPLALRYFDVKMQEKLEKHDYVRCDWRNRYYGVQYELPNTAPAGADATLEQLKRWNANSSSGSAPRVFAQLPRPNTPEAYAPGVYRIDQEPGWYYVVADPVPYGYALSPNAMLVERTAGSNFVPPGALLLPTWVWRATRESPAFLEPATEIAAAHAQDAVDRIQLELVAGALF